MGFETARHLAKHGAEVLMVSRDGRRGEDAKKKIQAEVGKDAKLSVLECDFRSLKNVSNLITRVRDSTDKIDIQCNMAGVFYPGPVNKSPEGIEQTLAINHYAHAALTLGVLDLVRKNPGSRIVAMSSATEVVGLPNWDDLKGQTYLTSGLVPYGTSKLYVAMFANELSKRVPEIDVFAVQPGLVNTPLHRKSDPRYPLNFIFKIFSPIFGSSPEIGAYSTLYAATDPSLTGTHFGFYGPRVLLLNLHPTKDRMFYRSGRVTNDPQTTRLFDRTQDILEELMGPDAPPRVQPLSLREVMQKNETEPIRVR